MHRGYFAVWRKFQDHPFWKEKRVYSKAEAWIDLLWEAQHELEPQEVVLGMTVLFCNYGESLKSLETWSKRWRWNKSRVRRFLKLLENMEQIVTINETKTTRITILNYAQYDPKRNKDETELKRKRNASETHSTPDNNVNNDKNDICRDYIPTASTLLEIVNLRRKNNLKSIVPWANTIRLLVEKDGVDHQEVIKNIEWYRIHWSDDYVPVIESAKSLREKWGKLLNAIDRGSKKTNKSCENCYYKIHENLDCHKEGRKECKSHRPV